MHLSLTVALVPPIARRPSLVVRSGAAYDYCIQSLGCTAEEAAKAERGIRPNAAESITLARVEESCGWLRSALDLSDTQLKKVVLRQPTLLHCRLESAASRLSWLKSRLGLSDTELKKVVIKRPSVLLLSTEANLAPRLEWFESKLGLSMKELKKMALRNPVFLDLSVEDNLAPRIEWLRSRLDLNSNEIKGFSRQSPTWFSLSIEENMEPTVEWLQSTLGLSGAELKKLLLQNPQLLNLSIGANLTPSLQWLQSRLNLDYSELKRVMLQRPTIISCSVEENLAPTAEWIQTTLNISDQELKKIGLLLPHMLTYSVEANMAPKLEWLQSRFDLNSTELRKIIVTLPALFGYNIEKNLEPKLEFLAQDLGLSPSEIRAAVMKGGCLSYSLEKRYKPRLEACKAAGVDKSSVLFYMKQSDEIFCRRAGIPREVLRAASGTPSMSPAAAVPSKLQRWHQLKVPSSWALAELRPWQLEVNEMIQEPTNNTGIWLFDSQTYPGRGKGTFFKHLIATTDDVFYEGTPSSFNVEAKQIQFAIDYIRDVSKQTRAMCYRLPRADTHNACFYEVLGAVVPETHVVVACSFWPDLRLLPNRRWRLFEWDDENNIHELPPGTDPGGRVGVGDTNREGDYIPYWNREPLL